jgi:site-specific DNA recombinase
MLLIEEFERGGCQIEFLDQPMSSNPHDQLLVQIRGAVAEYERSLIAERMRRGRLQKYRAGLLMPWTLPPYGYRVDPSHPRDPTGVRLEPAEAAVVAEMFEWYQQDHQSLVGLTKHLMSQIHGLRALVSCGSCHLSCTGRYRSTKAGVYAYYTRPRQEPSGCLVS